MNLKNITKLCAIAGVCASLNTGCVSMGSRPNYIGYLDASADKATLEAQKEAYQNQGYVVEATFTADGKVAYGVREKTIMEKTNGTLQKYGATIDTVYKAGDLANGVMGNISSWRIGDKIESAGKRSANAINKQTKVVKEFLVNSESNTR